MRVLAITLIASAGVLALAQDGSEQKKGEASSATSQQTSSAATTKAASGADADDEGSDVGLHPTVKMETSLGDIVLELNAEKAPITVDNFIRYAEDGYYEGTIFHRCIEGFMIQGGGFTPDMEQKEDGLRDPIRNEWRNKLRNRRGTIAMARTTDPDSATSQFFINVADNQRLNQPTSGGAAYCVFGKVTEGMDVVDAIVGAEKIQHPKYPSNQPVTPKEPIIIKSITLSSDFDRERCGEMVKLAESKRREATAAREKENADLEAQFKAILDNKQDEHGNKLQTTDSGLQYIVMEEGDGASPQSTDSVSVHYTGWLMNGKKFDSSRDRGQPATFPLNRVIAGWTEGVGLMKVGGHYLFIIPSDLAYGPSGRPPVIPPGATLVFDIELLEIK